MYRLISNLECVVFQILYSDIHGKGSVLYKFRVSIIEIESLYRPNSDLNLVSESDELSPALDREVLFSVSGSSKNQTEWYIYYTHTHTHTQIYIYIFIYIG